MLAYLLVSLFLFACPRAPFPIPFFLFFRKRVKTLTGFATWTRGVLPAATLHVRPSVPALPTATSVRPAQPSGLLARARVAEAGVVDGGANVEDVATVDPQTVHAADKVVAADLARETLDGVEVFHTAHAQPHAPDGRSSEESPGSHMSSGSSSHTSSSSSNWIVTSRQTRKITSGRTDTVVTHTPSNGHFSNVCP